MRIVARTIMAGIVFAGMAGAMEAAATEGGASLYVPGTSVPSGGILPPPGVYFDNTAYFYKAELSGGRTTRLGGNIVAEVKVDMWADFVTGLWVTPVKILGRQPRLRRSPCRSASPACARAPLLDGPIINRLLGRPLALSARDRDLNFGDPVRVEHARLALRQLALEARSGGQHPGRRLRARRAFQRRLQPLDRRLHGARLTYLDPALGIDLSAVGGFDGERREPRYGLSHRATSCTSISSATQVPDQGALGRRDRLALPAGHGGQRRGRYPRPVQGPGDRGRRHASATLSTVGKIPVSTRVKVLREVDVENRFRGHHRLPAGVVPALGAASCRAAPAGHRQVLDSALRSGRGARDGLDEGQIGWRGFPLPVGLGVGGERLSCRRRRRAGLRGAARPLKSLESGSGSPCRRAVTLDGCRSRSSQQGLEAAPSGKGASARSARAAQARLDPGQGAGLAAMGRDQPHRPREQARHRLRGGRLPQYRRVLGEEARHLHDHGRHLHAGLRLLQRQDRAARGRSIRTSPSTSPSRSPSSACRTS